MAINEILRADREPSPGWLRDAPCLARELAQKFLASRVVFYPGAGSDLHTLDVFGRAADAHCFVHADYLARTEPQDFHGYEVAVRQSINYESLVDLFEMDTWHPFSNEWERFTSAAAIERGLSMWVVYRRSDGRDDDFGPSHLAVLHAHAEAIWIYWNLWARRRAAPYAILLQDHGFGGNWTQFGSPGAGGEITAPLPIRNGSGGIPTVATRRS